MSTALMLAASYPPVPWPWLIWIAWIPLLIVLDSMPDEAEEDGFIYRCQLPCIYFFRIITLQFLYRKNSFALPERKRISKTRQAFRYLYTGFFVWNILTCYWLMLTALSVPTGEAFSSFLAGFFASAANPVLMSIPVLLWLKMHHRLNPVLSVLAFVSAWISFEYLHYHWDLSWSWITLGNAMSSAPLFIQFAEFTGIEGISMWILLINLFLFQAIRQGNFNLKIYWTLSCTLLAFLPLLLNIWILNPNRAVFQPESTLNVRIVQPNIDPYLKFDTDQLDAQLNIFYTLTDAPGADSIDLVVFPETAIPEPVWTHELSTAEPMKGFWTLLAKYPRMSILTGFTELKFYDRPPYPNSARPIDDGYFDYCNSAVILGSARMRTYQKSWLVPMVERIPFLDHLSVLKDYNIDIGGGLGSYGRSDSAFNLFTRTGVPVGPMICYESAFPDHVRGYTQRGARLLAVITNDAWWKQSSGYIQHAGLSVIRSIENRRDIVRSANTGISLFTDVYGNRYQDTDWWKETWIDRKVHLYTAQTFYVEYGEWLSKGALLMLAMMGVLAWVRSRKSE